MAAEWKAKVGDWSRGETKEWQVSEVTLWRDRRGEDEENGMLESLDVSAHTLIARHVEPIS